MRSPATAEPLLSSTLSDADLVAHVLGGEPALFELLMRRHNQRLYRALRAHLRDEAEIEELMQETYVRAYAHLGEFKGASAFSTWLLRIGINEALMRLRRKGVLHLLETDPTEEDTMLDIRADGPSPEDRVSEMELARFAEAAIDALPPHYRSVFMLRELEGMSTREVSEITGLNEDAVKQRLHRAKAQVQQSLYEKLQQDLPGSFRFPAHRCDRVVAAVLSKLHLP